MEKGESALRAQNLGIGPRSEALFVNLSFEAKGVFPSIANCSLIIINF
jgi:hypothetical protein